MKAPQVPQHVAIVMDGNGRWAKKRSLPVASGHKAGVETLRSVLSACEKLQITHLTLFAFSSENWGRSVIEVKALMMLFSQYLDNEIDELHRRGVRIQFIGRRDRFDKGLLKKLLMAESKTSANRRFYLNLAVDYGGQWDITQAAKSLASKVEQGELAAAEITEQHLAAELCLSNQPLPDLLIRTSGEFRISNFLLWQLAYAEFYFTDVLWPDFDEYELKKAVDDFQQRERRFGGRKN